MKDVKDYSDAELNNTISNNLSKACALSTLLVTELDDDTHAKEVQQMLAWTISDLLIESNDASTEQMQRRSDTSKAIKQSNIARLSN